MAVPLSIARISKLTGGVNTDDDVMAVGRFQAQTIRNMHINEHGIAFTRGGSRLINTTALPAAVSAIYDFRRPLDSGVTATLVVKAGTKLYSINETTGAATEIYDMGSTNRPTFATFQDGNSKSYMFVTDGVTFIKWNGTDAATDAATTYPWGTGGQPKYIWVYDDRLLAAGMDDEPYRVFVSDTLDGTDWYGGAESAAQYWTLKSPNGDRITGLHSFYDFGVIQQQYGTTIITEANPDSDTSQQIKVSHEFGTSSHWSVQTVGNYLYFADASHIYRGELRAAVENGLEVRTIDEAVQVKYDTVQNHSDIVSAYDAVRKEIQWGCRTAGSAKSDLTLVYNLALSGNASTGGTEHVWSGWFDGERYQPYTLASVLAKETGFTAGGDAYTTYRQRVYRGDTDGFIYVMDEDDQYKDEKYESGATVEYDIISEIHTAPYYPGGLITTKRLRDVAISLFQYYDESTTIQWKLDGRRILPATARSINYRNIVPYWADGTDSDIKTLWNNTTWMNQPMLAKPIAANAPFQYIQFIIKNAGTNARDRMSYSGGEFTYQRHGVRRNY